MKWSEKKKRPRKSVKKSSRRALFEPLVSTIISLVLAVIVTTGLGWFANNKKVTAAGMTVAVKSTPDLLIRAAQNDQDIDAADAANHFLISEKSTAVLPGSNGQFTFWISCKDGGTGLESGGTATVKPAVLPGAKAFVNGQFVMDDSVAAYKEVSSDDVKQQATNYLQGHILLFFHKNAEGVYSGWLDPFEPTAFDFTAGQPVTIYWVWAEHYEQLTTLIDTKDSAKLFAHYQTLGAFNENATTYLFYQKDDGSLDSSLLTRYYDAADEVIGRTIANTFFELTFDLIS